MKFTAKQLIEFAGKAGVPLVEIVEDESLSDYDENTALLSVQTAAKDLLKPAIESELKGSLELAAKAKSRGEILSLLARESGIARAELDKLATPEATALVFKTMSEKLGGDAATWKGELDKLVETHNNSLSTKEKEWNEKLTAATQRYVDRDIDSYLSENIVGKAPLRETADKAYYAELLRTHLQNKYHLSYDDAKKAVSTFKKDNPEIPALNEAGTATINLMDEFKGIATRAGVWETDTRNIRPNGNVRQNNQQQQQQQQPQAPQTTKGRRGKVNDADLLAHLDSLEAA